MKEIIINNFFFLAVKGSSSLFERWYLTMKHLAAYLLLVAGGNTSPSAEDIKTLLTTVGVEVDQSRVSALIKAMEGKTAAEVNFANVHTS